MEILIKTICGFLNCKGGSILIGVGENMQTKMHRIFGQKISEYAK